MSEKGCTDSQAGRKGGREEGREGGREEGSNRKKEGRDSESAHP